MRVDGGGGEQGDYTLDVDPAAVTAAATKLAGVHSSLQSAHDTLSGLSGHVEGVIRGEVATSFLFTYAKSVSELTDVVSKVGEAASALKALGAAYDHGKNTVLPKINAQLHTAQHTLNTALNAASDTYTTAVTGTHPDQKAASSALTSAENSANGAYATDIASLDRQYEALITELQHASTTASGKLQDLTDGSSLYEDVDKLNALIGYGLSPAALGLAGPEIKALKTLLDAHDAYADAARGLNGNIDLNTSKLLQLAEDQNLTQADTARLLAQDQANLEKQVSSLGKAYEEAVEKAGRSGGLPEAEAAEEAALLSKLAGPLDLLAKGTAGIGMLTDVLTLINPGADGAEGWANRAAAAGNFVGTPLIFSKKILDKLSSDESAAEKAASAAGDAGADGSLDAAAEGGAELVTDGGGEIAASELTALGATSVVPVAGQVIVVGTGLYLAGDWAYNNVSWFHDGVNDAGHAVGGFGGWVDSKVENLVTLGGML